ncbi:alpha/beta hydrolase [Sorangium sp. So ce296]|uniref:alpha/beta fold hydrolase n=1 Tax=Sorangium sp. So ce296 TaxID=3133296 RepID=UPI003F621AC4
MFVSVKGAELFYSVQGDGPACLVLSSIGTRPYERQMPAQLSDRLKLVHVDLRGSGRSTGDPADLTFDALAEDLESVRSALGLERIAVLGHSILGALAVEYGRRCPGSVSHVIAVGTPPSGDMALLSARSASFFEEDASEERKRILRDNLSRLPKDAPPGHAMLAQTPLRFFDPRIDAAPLFAEADVKPQFFAHLLGRLAPAWDIRVDSGSLRVPIFLALGRYDYAMPHVLWEGVAPTLPTLTPHLFERSGHQPFFEEPERFTAAVTAWMDLKR